MKITVPEKELKEYAERIAMQAYRARIKRNIEREVEIVNDFREYADKYWNLQNRVSELELELSKMKAKGFFKKFFKRKGANPK